MKQPAALSPLGTARGAPDPSAPPFPHYIGQAVRDRDLGEDAAYLAWEMVRCVRGATPRELEALLLTVLASIISLKEGSTRLPIGESETLRNVIQSLGADEDLADLALDLLAKAAKSKTDFKGHEILGRPGDYKPLILDGDYLYHQRLLVQEERVAGSLAQRLHAADIEIDKEQLETSLRKVLDKPALINAKPVHLSEEQQEAVTTALRRSLTVISGGPGTGKTSVVVSILRVLARMDVPMESMALAAPTGKAANRMEESVKSGLLAVPEREESDQTILDLLPEAKTLHRLLGYQPSIGGFRHHQNNPLSQKVVIVDEASMIDLELMDRLVRAVSEDARLILLGDADQLPSVDAGAVFRDLLPPKQESESSTDRRRKACVLLTQNYRMDPKDPAGLNILSVAQQINAGRSDALFDENEPEHQTIAVRSSVSAVRFHGVELLSGGSSGEKKRAFLERWFTDRVTDCPDFEPLISRKYSYRHDGFDAADSKALETLFRHSNSHRILCVTASDCDHANYVLHHKMAGTSPAESRVRSERTRFHVGEPVMMLRNDYDRGLFNGDQGLVLRVSTDDKQPRSMAVFLLNERFATFELETLGSDITLSMAMTVHKSQGSEFDHVALVLPDQKVRHLTREILYTAATRSRGSVVILGTKEVISATIQRQMVRFSGIGEALDE